MKFNSKINLSLHVFLWFIHWHIDSIAHITFRVFFNVGALFILWEEDGGEKEDFILHWSLLPDERFRIRNSHLETIFPSLGNTKAISAKVFHYSQYLDHSFVELERMINTFWQTYSFKSYVNESQLHIFFYAKFFIALIYVNNLYSFCLGQRL